MNSAVAHSQTSHFKCVMSDVLTTRSVCDMRDADDADVMQQMPDVSMTSVSGVKSMEDIVMSEDSSQLSSALDSAAEMVDDDSTDDVSDATASGSSMMLCKRHKNRILRRYNRNSHKSGLRAPRRRRSAGAKPSGSWRCLRKLLQHSRSLNKSKLLLNPTSPQLTASQVRDVTSGELDRLVEAIHVHKLCLNS